MNRGLATAVLAAALAVVTGTTILAAPPASAGGAPALSAHAGFVDKQSRIPVHALAYDSETGDRLVGVPVRMVVQAGGPTPAGTELDCGHTCVTDASGQVRGELHNDQLAGHDPVLVHLDLDDDGVVGTGEPSKTVYVTWTYRATVVTPVASTWNPDYSVNGITAYLHWHYGDDCSNGGGYGGCPPVLVPMAGRTVHFYARNSTSVLCLAVTDARGVARCGGIGAQAASIAAGGFRAIFYSDGIHHFSSGDFNSIRVT